MSEVSYLHRWKPEEYLRREEYWDRMQHKFACAIGSKDPAEAEPIDDPMSVNKMICSELEKMRGLYEMDKVKGKALGYRKAISMIKAYKHPIKSVKQLDDIPYVGDGIKKKVKEFLETGSMSKLKFLS